MLINQSLLFSTDTTNARHAHTNARETKGIEIRELN